MPAMKMRIQLRLPTNTVYLFATCLVLSVVLSQTVQASEITRGLQAVPKSLHPHHFGGTPDAQVIKDIYEGLMVQNKNGEPVPGVAEDVERSLDGLTYTFKLRSNLKWSDGSPLTSEDFIRSFKGLADPANKASYRWYLKVANIKGAESALAGNLDDLGITAKDNLLTIHLDQPTPYFLGLMTFPSFLPVHSDNMPRTRWGTPITNGPYKVSSISENTKIELVSNEYYFRYSKTDIHTVTYQIIQSTSEEVSRFESKQLNITGSLPALHIGELRKEHPVSVFEHQLLATSGLIINKKVKVLDNVKVRQALSLAIDRHSLVKNVYPHSKTHPACSFIAPMTHGFNPDPANCRKLLHNPDRIAQAKKALAESGVKGSDIKLTILSTTKYDSMDILPEISKQMNSTLGTEFEIKSADWKDFLNRVTEGDYDIVWFGWLAAYNDATAFLYPLKESTIFGPFENAEFSKQLTLAAQQDTAVKRLPYYRKAETILARELPIIPILHPSSMTLVNPDISGYYSSNPEGWVHSWRLYRVLD